MEIQRIRILDLLRQQEWTCVEEMLALYIVDYRRRLTDIKRMGYDLESRRCQKHTKHGGGSKEWRIKPSTSPESAPTASLNQEMEISGLWYETDPWTGVATEREHEIYA